MAQQERRQTDDHQESSVPALTPEATECIEFLGNWNQSLFGFYLGRLQEIWKVPFELHAFSSPEQYIQLHERFLKKMVADYAGQAEKLMEIAHKELQVSQDPAQSEYAAHLLKAQEDAAKIIDQAKAQAEHIVAAAEDRAGEAATKPEQQHKTPRRRKSA